MGLFGFGKKGGVVDLGERYRKQQEKAAEMREEAESSTETAMDAATQAVTPFSIFGGATPTASSTEETSVPESTNITSGLDPAERRRRLVKRLKDMTDRMEDLSNQIYKLQQRVDVLERKV